MKTPDFRQNLAAAQELKLLSGDPFWEGYIRGLRRGYHGENFGTLNEHLEWMALADEPGNDQHKDRGDGYRAGLSGTPIAEITRMSPAITTAGQK